MNISLVIPTLNEEEGIESLLKLVVGAIASCSKVQNAEIVVVDDGSTDQTVSIIQNLQLNYPVKIIHRKVRGLATAVLEGFSNSQYEILGVMDADLSHPPEVMKELLSNLPEYDLVQGSRNLPGGLVEKWPWYRKLSSKFATLLTRPLGVKSTDPMSGFFFLKREILERTTLSPIGYKILLEILVKCAPFKLKEVPYIFKNRSQGKSKMGAKESFNYLRHLGRLLVWKLSRKK